MPRRTSRRSLYDPSLSLSADTMPVIPTQPQDGDDNDGFLNIERERFANGGGDYDDDEDPLGQGVLLDDGDSYAGRQSRRPLPSPSDDADEIVDHRRLGLRLPRRKRVWLQLGAVLGALAMVIGLGVGLHQRRQPASAPAPSPTASSSSSVGFLPRPPANLAVLCAPDRIQSSPEALTDCQAACQPSECCDYPSNLDLSCLDTDTDACFEYHKSCGILTAKDSGKVDGLVIPEAPSNLNQICSFEALARAGPTGVRLCATLCEPQRCCYETELQGAASCRAIPQCAGYVPCLNLRAHDNVQQHIQQEVERKCSQGGSLGDCAAVCSVARCCFLGDLDCQYKTEEEPFCDQYAACENLPGWGPEDHDDGDPTFSPTMETTFQPTPSPSLESGWTFEPTVTAVPTQLSLDDPNAVSNFLPALPPDISDTCGNAASDDDSYYRCDEMCALAECCSIPSKFPQSCLGTQTQLCMEYSLACAGLDANATHNTVTLDIQNGNLADATLGDVCSAESISYTFGLKECRKRCKPAHCCWMRNGPRCDDPRCLVYSPCLNLVAMNVVSDAIIETVQTACRQSMLKTWAGRAVCESVCLQHKCCYDDSCLVDDPSVCDQYDGCKILHEMGHVFASPNQTTLVKPVNLQDMCDPMFLDSESFYYKCAAACSAADCCSYPANMDISCLKGNENTCFTYHRECAGLRTKGKTTNENANIERAPGNLATLCSPTSLSTSYGLSQCEDYCYSASCCWMEDISVEEYCVDNDNCPGYAPCLNLRASFTNSSEIVNEVNTKCTIPMLMVPGGRQACDAVCRQHNCCWDPGAEACFQETDCRQYEGCQLLTDLDQNGVPDVLQVTDPATFPPAISPPLMPSTGGDVVTTPAPTPSFPFF